MNEADIKDQDRKVLIKVTCGLNHVTIILDYPIYANCIMHTKTCKVHMLQSAHVAKCTCCKVHMLQSAHVAKYTCCNLHMAGIYQEVHSY